MWEAFFDYFGNLLNDIWRMFRFDMYVLDYIIWFLVGLVSAVAEIKSDIQTKWHLKQSFGVPKVCVRCFRGSKTFFNSSKISSALVPGIKKYHRSTIKVFCKFSEISRRLLLFSSKAWSRKLYGSFRSGSKYSEKGALCWPRITDEKNFMFKMV